MEGVGGHGPKNLTLRKNTLFFIEKYVEDVKQEEKDVPDLVESIMKGSGLVKEELRRILFKIIKWVNLDPKSKKIGFQLFGCPEKSRISGGGCLQEQSRLLLTHFHLITAPKTKKIQKICGFWPVRAILP